MGPINSTCVSTIQCLFHVAQHDVVLNQHRRGLPPRSFEYLLIHSHPSHPVILNLSTLSFLTQPQINVLINLLATLTNKEHSPEISRVESATRLLPWLCLLSIAILTDFQGLKITWKE
jgi:hypothetical protein